MFFCLFVVSVNHHDYIYIPFPLSTLQMLMNAPKELMTATEMQLAQMKQARLLALATADIVVMGQSVKVKRFSKE